MQPTARPRLSSALTALAALVAAGWLSTSAAAPPSDAAGVSARALAAWDAGDREAAAQHFAEAARAAADPGLWTLAGDMALSLRRPEAAAEAWSEALALTPKDPDLLDRLAQAEALRGDWAAAASAQRRLVAVLSVVAKADPRATRREMSTGQRLPLTQSHRWHMERLATLAALAGDFTTAEEAARSLIRLDRKAIGGHLALGYVFLQAGEYGEAMEAFREALVLDPAHPVALNNLGTAYYMDRDLKAAGGQFEAVLDSELRGPDNESIALANLAELQQLEARYGDAEYLYAQAIEAFPRGAWSYMGRAALLDLTGRYDEAVDAMIDGWERDTNHATRLNMHFFQPEWAWQRDALIAEIEGDLDRAVELWQRVARGDVEALHRAATDHLDSLQILLGK